MSEDRKPQSADKYIVRFPDGMRDRIAEEAKANNRSMNAEIVARLEASFGKATTEVEVHELAVALAEHLAAQGMRLAVADAADNSQIAIFDEPPPLPTTLKVKKPRP